MVSDESYDPSSNVLKKRIYIYIAYVPKVNLDLSQYIVQAGENPAFTDPTRCVSDLTRVQAFHRVQISTSVR